jgi:hydroxyacylglutathione hydrolase
MEKQEYGLHRISLVGVAAYLLFKPGEAILVDSGRQGSEEKILLEMARMGLQPTDLKLLILTHAHYDHAGSAQRLKEVTGCRILIHRKEASRLEAGFTPIPSGTRWKAKVVVAVGRIFARHLMKFPSASPDILMEDFFNLAEFGFPGRLIHTPGHTPGSVVVLLEKGEMITGDTLFGLAGKRIFPPFAEDKTELKKSWKKISEMEINIFYPAHGVPISGDKFMKEFVELS